MFTFFIVIMNIHFHNKSNLLFPVYKWNVVVMGCVRVPMAPTMKQYGNCVAEWSCP